MIDKINDEITKCELSAKYLASKMYADYTM